MSQANQNKSKVHATSLSMVAALGILIGGIASRVFAQMSGPTEH